MGKAALARACLRWPRRPCACEKVSGRPPVVSCLVLCCCFFSLKRRRRPLWCASAVVPVGTCGGGTGPIASSFRTHGRRILVGTGAHSFDSHLSGREIRNDTLKKKTRTVIRSSRSVQAPVSCSTQALPSPSTGRCAPGVALLPPTIARAKPSKTR